MSEPEAIPDPKMQPAAVAAEEAVVVIPPARSPEEIEADIAAARERLIGTVGQLERAVKRATDPVNVAKSGVRWVASFYVDEYGGVRPERIAVTVGVVVSVVVVRRVAKRIF